VSRRPTILGLAADAEALLDAQRSKPSAAVTADALAAVRRVVEHAARCVARAERESAREHADGAHREAEVARLLGVDPATLYRWRAAQRARQAAE